MPILKNMTIKRKLTVIIMLTCLFGLLATGTVFITYDFIQLRQNMVRSLSVQSEIMANNCKAALAFDDPKDARETLAALHAEPSIVYACIQTKEDKVFATYQQGKTDETILQFNLKKQKIHFTDRFLAVLKDIVLDQETIGSVTLVSDLSPMYAMFWRNTAIVLVVLIFAFLSAYLIASKLQAVISKPILSLNEIAKIVSENKDYSVRAQKQTNDETGMLINSFNEMLEQIQLRDANLIKEIEERKKTEKMLKRTQRDLMQASHQAGMAEVATDVLHNVGNVLNSVNVAVSLIREKLSRSKMSNLQKIAAMLEEHSEDLQTFLTEDPQGKHIPGYLIKIHRILAEEQENIIKKLLELEVNVQHIKEIIQTQQTYAKVGGVEVAVPLVEIIENAIQINKAGLERHQITLIKEFVEIDDIYIDKQKVVQIIVNLINNAKYALANSKSKDKLLTVRFYKHGEDRIRIEVADNGVGIPEENLTKIFRHGFTTKNDGHGFGLHSGALAAKEMKGSLTVHSDGQEQGATFTLEIPYHPVKAYSNIA